MAKPSNKVEGGAVASQLLKPSKAERGNQEEKTGTKVDWGHKPVYRCRPGGEPAARSPRDTVEGGAVASMGTGKHPAKKGKKEEGMEARWKEDGTHRK